MFPGCLQDFSRIFSGCSDWVLWAWWNLMIISNESMVFNDPKELDDPQLFDGPQRWYLHHWWSCYLLQSEFMGSTFNYQSDTDLCTGQTGGPPALRLPCVQDQATRSHLHSDWLGSPPGTPHICHGRHGWCPCKFFLAGVHFYRFNAKNWQFTVWIGNILCKFWCKFYSPKILPV